MAKVNGPLLSQSAHGKIAQVLTHSARRAGNIVRKSYHPHKEPTLAQRTQRTIVGLLTAQWQCMTDEEREAWNTSAISEAPGISGFNYFLRMAQADLQLYHGLYLFWPFNTAPAATTPDASGAGNTATLFPTYPTNCPILTPSMNERFGKAIYFDGVDDSIRRSPLSLGDIYNTATIQMWIKFETIVDRTTLLTIQFSGNLQRYSLWISLTRLYFAVQADSWAYSANTWITISTADIGKWFLFTLVLDGTQMLTYKNKTLIRTGTREIKTGTPSAIYLALPIIQPNYFNGTVDNVLIYNRALSAAEIAKHYDLLRKNKVRQYNVV